MVYTTELLLVCKINAFEGLVHRMLTAVHEFLERVFSAVVYHVERFQAYTRRLWRTIA